MRDWAEVARRDTLNVRNMPSLVSETHEQGRSLTSPWYPKFHLRIDETGSDLNN